MVEHRFHHLLHPELCVTAEREREGWREGEEGGREGEEGGREGGREGNGRARERWKVEEERQK